MNFRIREVVKSKDIFKTCDLMAVRNPDDKYFIFHDKHDSQRGRVSESDFKAKLLKSREPIVLSSTLFSDYL